MRICHASRMRPSRKSLLGLCFFMDCKLFFSLAVQRGDNDFAVCRFGFQYLCRNNFPYRHAFRLFPGIFRSHRRTAQRPFRTAKNADPRLHHCFITLIGLFFSPNFFVLSIFRLFQGIGTALLISTSTAIAVNITPLYKRGSILGIMTSASYLGASLGPIIGGAIATFLTWRYLFLFLLIPNILGLILFRNALRLEWCTLDGEQFDTKGAVMLGLGTGAISLGAGLMSIYFSLIWLVPFGFVLLAFLSICKNTPNIPLSILIFSPKQNLSPWDLSP